MLNIAGYVQVEKGTYVPRNYKTPKGRVTDRRRLLTLLRAILKRSLLDKAGHN